MDNPIPKERPQPNYDSDGRMVIDGSILEGGGQILRNSAALSCILGIAIKVINIRAGRQKPGLRPQHMTGLEIIAQLCNGRLKNCNVGSCEVTLDPGQIGSGHFVADTKTAGSICLLLQAAGPCLLYGAAPSRLTLRGGTNADMAPQIDYTTLVFKPIAEKFGMQFDIDIKRRGYFPKGGGEVEVTAAPIRALTAVPEALSKRGDVSSIYSRSFVAGSLPEHLSGKVSRSIAGAMRQNLPGVSLKQDSVKESSAIGNGLGTIIVAETNTGCLLGGSALGKPRAKAEDAGAAAVEELLRGIHSGGAVDEYLQDQLILLMALAEGSSRVLCGPLTLHTQTAIHIARLMTKAEFSVETVDPEAGTVMVTCQGIGHQNPHLAAS